jgi:hypothetical protein
VAITTRSSSVWSKVHQETPQAIGLSGEGGMLTVLVSPERGWTMLVTYPKRDAAARRRAGLTVTGETPREDRSVAPTFLNSPAQGCLTTSPM